MRTEREKDQAEPESKRKKCKGLTMANPPNLARTGPHAAGGTMERDRGLWFAGESNMFILSETAGFQTEMAT